jgi:outer membrane protein assembly factor BamD (BamD/ComL family)
LLQAAQLARRSGMTELAIERLDRVISGFPASELAHNASVEKFRVLAEAGQLERARRAALEYLQRHPGGFARAEAQRLAGP